LVCATRGQNVNGFFTSDIPGGWDDLWYRTSDGHFVADADIATASLNVAAPDATRDPPRSGSGAAQSPTSTARPAGRREAIGDGRSVHLGCFTIVTEMNNSQLAGVGIFNDRDAKYVPGMPYILWP
jgi:hypothetical protein